MSPQSCSCYLLPLGYLFRNLALFVESNADIITNAKKVAAWQIDGDYCDIRVK